MASKLIKIITGSIEGLKDGVVGTLNATNTFVKGVSTTTEYLSEKYKKIADKIEENTGSKKNAKMINYLKNFAEEVSSVTGEDISYVDIIKYVAKETTQDMYQTYLDKKEQTEESMNKVEEILRGYQDARRTI